MSDMAGFFQRKKAELGVELNEVQAKAAAQTDGPMLLLAVPGSGKTTTIIMRTGYLIEEKGVAPSRIKAVTFSRASAMDMKERFSRFFPELPTVDFSTIHSLAFEVMREYFWRKRISYKIIEGDITPEEQETVQADGQLPLHKKIILRNIYSAVARERITDDQLEDLTTYISFIKNKMLPSDQWKSVKCDVPQAELVLQEYEAFKQSGHASLLVDFDDMLTWAEQALEEDGELLGKYQRRYDYLLIDEGQDTSLVQHAIAEKLARVHRNLCIVADDDQSIYSWRGAEPSYLLRFSEVYPNAAILYMEQNYRSSKGIVHIANEFIKRNKNRYAKNMFTDNPSRGRIKHKSFSRYESQTKYLVQEIKGIGELGEAAILYRNNSSSIALMNAFDRAGIPFYMKDADIRFFNHWIVEDILNFMRLTFSDKRADILEKIHLKLNAYITRQQMESIRGLDNNESVFDNLKRYAPIQDYQVKLLQECKETFEQMRGIPPLEAIRTIRGKLGYEKAIEKMCERLGFRKEYLLGILNTLEGIAEGLETMVQFHERLRHLEAELKKSKRRKGQNAVTFSTFHSAKGLEFEHVYMIDLVEGIIPSKDDERGAPEVKQALMEEAARLFYVGMTRAKQNLQMISYKERDGEKTAESRFISEVRNILNPPQQAGQSGQAAGQNKQTAASRQGSSSRQVSSQRASSQRSSAQQHTHRQAAANPNAIRNRSDLARGQSIKHRVFGSGTVSQVTAKEISIRFTTGEKTLDLTTCLEMGLLELI
ncbi:ATP-dependent helicase [Paenibacillus sp. YN15]|uniref:ATP-dependent helicase n=1 Tax=Paenibacillus sp. YN15 TaxID=1742774 RepID=UPI000DCD98FB|nr:ATP-dependent helicase [Paenibacillus sp. YN15]RAU98900.1 ATP-dependent helicase [Paenibacillus sp. YN15]